MRKLLCWLNYHPWSIPAWGEDIRFCAHCMEWERKVDGAWARITSIEDFLDYAEAESGEPDSLAWFREGAHCRCGAPIALAPGIGNYCTRTGCDAPCLENR